MHTLYGRIQIVCGRKNAIHYSFYNVQVYSAYSVSLHSCHAKLYNIYMNEAKTKKKKELKR